eukprot:CAMPEP_0195293834 /NCGR_PEP_ID=MMETSP0707-20130614/13496_1 /TAXON_ID=33640 /ORGANISM="Asterionellopsis glacialis, Strain CCMP134" /LENGTH=539 /DNA_ID=CAMNT_0040354639 /DNA_START=22 /DNA_END=1641 /DNA_ORIENTATION=-
MSSYPTPVELDCIILGAGPSGLAAAHRLRECYSHRIVVLEGRNRVGGRAYTRTTPDGVNLDLGGKWIHGDCMDNRMVQLMDEYNCKFEPSVSRSKARGRRKKVTRLVLPSTTQTPISANPSRKGMQVANKVFQEIKSSHEKVHENDAIKNDLTLEEYLLDVHKDCLPKDRDGSWKDLFYRNLIFKLIDPGDIPIDSDESAHFLNEVLALVNLKICIYYESWEGAPINKISVQHGLDGTELSGGDAEVSCGYGGFIRKLAEPLLQDGVIRLNHKVTSVISNDSADGGVDISRVTVRCEMNDGYQTEVIFRAKFCIVALPLGVLRQGTTGEEHLFSPPLSQPINRAIQSLGITVANKLTLSFPSRWWAEGTGWLYIASSHERTPTFHPFELFLVESEATKDNPTAPNVLVCYIRGEFAKQAEHWSSADLQKWCMAALYEAGFHLLDGFENELPDPTFFDMTRWHSDPFSRGTWTYYAKNTCPETIAAFRNDKTSADRGLYFCGEHTCDGSVVGLDIGCVHSAWLSGEMAVDRAISTRGSRL